VVGRLAEAFPGLAPSPEAVTASLESMVANRLMLRDEGLYLALALGLASPDIDVAGTQSARAEALIERVC
jgi:hypothetical protein